MYLVTLLDIYYNQFHLYFLYSYIFLFFLRQRISWSQESVGFLVFHGKYDNERLKNESW